MLAGAHLKSAQSLEHSPPEVQLHLGMGTDPEGFVSYHKAKGIQLQAYSVLGNSMTHHASSWS